MAIIFKQRCFKCKKNYVVVTRNDNYAVCYECQKDDMKGTIKDPVMKKMFDIPEDFYIQNSFLRNIKVKYLRYGQLTEKQIAAFVKTVDKMNNPNAKESKRKAPEYGESI